MSFVHLQVHSEYSLQDSLVRVDALIQRVVKEKMPAVALTDVDNVFGFVKFYQTALKHGIKPICGVDLTVTIKGVIGRVLLIAKNNQGYHDLLYLVSLKYTQYPQGVPLLEFPERCEHLIMIISPWQSIHSVLFEAGQQDKVSDILTVLKLHFHHRLYLGLLGWSVAKIQQVDRWHLALCEQFNIAPVALGAVCFLQAEQFKAHQVRVCIHASRLLYDASFEPGYFQEQSFENQLLIERFEYMPKALNNTLLIAKQATVTLELGRNYLPEVMAPNHMHPSDYFRAEAEAGLVFRFGNQIDDVLRERLNEEVGIILRMGFASYFLIVADFISWAKSQKIPVGPGRGSGAGSLVAYVLKITDINPLKYGLLFERFLNPERVSMPDFDIDFCMDRRDEVIQYVVHKYGKEAVSQIITYGTMAAKAVVRDVGRVLGQPYGFMDKLAKLIPFELGITLEKAMEKEKELERRYKTEEAVKQVIDLSLELEGLVRNVGRHAGGVVIAPGKLTNFTALYQESIESIQPVTQYDKDDIEKIGLVKFDFLGLRTLTIIDWACQTIRDHQGLQVDFSIEKIPLDDLKTFELIQKGNTTGVFQVESRGMKDLILRLVPDCFEDLVALVALYRPGPLQSGMVDDFIDRKHGRSDVAYPHASLSEILKPTYGVILYQEQVMQIAQVLSGYSLGAADLLRRAMGKKKVEEMEAQRALFVDGAKKQGVDPDQAGGIFDLVEKFAGYGFNKSHSAAYALITYQTAWLKANHPDALMSAVLSSDMDNTDKVVGFYEDTLKQNIKVLPVCINSSMCRFVVEEPMVIRYGLAAIKGVGDGFAQSVVHERKARGPYRDIIDFCVRLEHAKVNRKMLEALIKAGACDCLGQERGILYASIDRILAQRDKLLKDQCNFQGDMLGGIMSAQAQWQAVGEPWLKALQLSYERDVLGLYLSSHPMLVFRQEVAALGAKSLLELKDRAKNVLVGAVFLSSRVVYTKTGKRLIILVIEDEKSKEELLLSEQEYERAQVDLKAGEVLLFEVTVSIRHDGAKRFLCDRIWTIADRRLLTQSKLLIAIEGDQFVELAPALNHLFLVTKSGRCQVQLMIKDGGLKINVPCKKTILLDSQWLEQLKKLPGVICQVKYC
ncbi:MAG: DNA polymerase III subunit alpha [Gammaproteobacteria bacterium]|nr:DNA polymerase III subunit alpha [Gammaproteobacteria bacterium]